MVWRPGRITRVSVFELPSFNNGSSHAPPVESCSFSALPPLPLAQVFRIRLGGGAVTARRSRPFLGWLIERDERVMVAGMRKTVDSQNSTASNGGGVCIFFFFFLLRTSM